MNFKRMSLWATVAILCISLSSCLVSKKKFDEQEGLAKKYLEESKDCNEKLTKANEDIAALNEQIKKLDAEIAQLKDNNTNYEQKNKKLQSDYQDANNLYEKLKKQLEDLGKSTSSEKEKLSLALSEKGRQLNEKAAELDQLSDKLKEREKRVNELESLIAKKDEAVNSLKKKISDALNGFTSDELKVTQKDGKVYVSLSDKLLFKSGSFSVDEKGKSAIVKVAEVLTKQTDIGIVVEGHTDNKQYLNPKGEIKNNWDLSVMRASSVTQILVNEGKLDAKRVAATGHSEYFPVEANDTPEGRSKNRRTDLVLSPDLKEIFKILDSVK